MDVCITWIDLAGWVLPSADAYLQVGQTFILAPGGQLTVWAWDSLNSAYCLVTGSMT